MPNTKSKKDVPGKLIAVEGIDGSGKSTQLYLLKRWLELEGYRVFFTEWNSSAIVKRATRRGKKSLRLTPTTFSLIHATDFADRFERQIMPLLHAGFIVLADRYIYTAFARDTIRGCDREWVRQLYGFARPPDITFYFDVPLETALGRILGGRPVLKYHEAGMDLNLAGDTNESFKRFQGLILEEYQRMAKEFNFTIIDASQPPEAQQPFVRRMVEKEIPLKKYKLVSPPPTLR